MADMEEKLSGEFLFDNHYISETVRSVSDGVKEIIEMINTISHGKYSLLHERFDAITAEIGKVISGKRAIPESSYMLTFDEINKEMVHIVGGKNANLGEIRNHVGLPTPDGFAVSAYAFKRFMDHNSFTEKINELLSGIPSDSIEELNKTSRIIVDMVAGGEIPADLRGEIEKAIENMKVKAAGRTLRVAVRSSAIQEDGEFSFAGQYISLLNIPPERILQGYKDVIASLFVPRALFYYKSKGLDEDDICMSVGVLEMVNAKAAGVIYTRDPNRPSEDLLLISSAHGLGKSVVEGLVTPESYVLSKKDLCIVEHKRSEQHILFSCRSDGDLEQVSLTHDMKEIPSLNERELKILAEYALSIERSYGTPQDIEWAIDRNERVFMLQTRPLRIETTVSKVVPSYIPGYNILIDRGIIACKGIGYGKVHMVKTDEDLKDFPEKGILVAKHTSPKYVMVMNKASAIVTDFGGASGHMASLAREYDVPALLDTEIGTQVLKNNHDITVDAFNGTIYEGKVTELLALAGKRANPFKDSFVMKKLRNVLKWIVPLNLYDPQKENFKPEFCVTFHDITRFCHEMATHEMFSLSDTSTGDEVSAKTLKEDIPIMIYILDIGGGLAADAPKTLRLAHVNSAPFNAFFKGLASMRWPQGSPSVDAKGFLGMLAHTVSMPEEQLRKIGEGSFAFVSGEYMNFTLRLGYHLSTVEAYMGENLNDNYIRFFFKGGGAAIDRRLRRVRLIREILRAMDFEVRVAGDVVDAVLSKYSKPLLRSRLEIMGKLTVYTKQLDMVMYNDAITDWYIEEFLKDHLQGNSTKVTAGQEYVA